MLHHFEEYGYYAEITAFKGACFEQADAFLKANRKAGPQKVWIQFFNAELIATGEHLYFAVLNALSAFRGGTNLSKSLAMETMLYAASQRQIQKAIMAVGLKPDTSEVAVVIIGETPEAIESAFEGVKVSLKAEVCESVLDLTPQKTVKIKEAFKLTPKMLQTAKVKGKSEESALVDLVVEQVALLSTQL
jgi:tRNA threonylcarbamoyladenosine modification (KEOPS) complex Cgi121 subunit